MAAIFQLFDQLLAENGSDLHLSVGYPPMIRKHGELVPLNAPVLTIPAVEKLLREIVDEVRMQKFRDEWDLDFAYGYENKARFRANYLMKTTGPGAVFRTIPSKVLTAKDLHLPEACLRLAERRAGLVLVTGPTGSGKSTTLAAMLDYINETRSGHILTIEDPVEFVHQPKRCLITHREVGLDTPSFQDAIRSAGRENADTILVGELRGAETMRLALQLASFGVLIFATVHTNSASATIERFVNAFPSEQQPQIRGLLADSLAGIVAQQLLRRAGGGGRVAAHEILVSNMGVASAIRESKTALLPSLMQSGAREGMQTMDACLLKLLQAKAITAADAMEKSLDKESFARLPAVRDALDAGGARME
jgi:twitching motility protein PilT